MNEVKKTKILAIVGMSGAGKSVAVKYLTERGVPRVYFGGMTLGEMKKRGIEITPENEKIFREQIRREEGNDWVARQAIVEIKDLIGAGQRRVVLDGVYSWTEYRVLKHEFPGELIFVAILADKAVRYERLASRPERPFSRLEAEERDYNETEKLEKGGPIANADYFIFNDGSVEELEQKLKSLLQKIDFWD